MSISSGLLDALIECSRTGQLTKAARKLFITQSALSQRIHALEEELKTPVLVRSRTGVTLTDAGETLLRYCLLKEELERQTLDAIHSKNADRVMQKIRMTGYSSIMTSLVFHSLEPLILSHPNLHLDFRTAQMNTILSNLQKGNSDYVFLDHGAQSPGIQTEILGYEQNVLVQKKGYKGPDVYLDHNESDHTTLEYFRDQKIGLIRRSFLGDIFGLVEGVKLGFGRAILPRHLIEKVEEVEIINPKRVLQMPIVLCFNEQLMRVQYHAEILKSLKAGMRALLAQQK